MFKRFTQNKNIMTRILLSLDQGPNFIGIYDESECTWDFSKISECLVDYLIIEDTANKSYCILKSNKYGQITNITEIENTNLSLDEYYYKVDQRTYSLEKFTFRATLFSDKNRFLVYFKTNSIKRLNNTFKSRNITEWIKFFPCMKDFLILKNDSAPVYSKTNSS